MPDANYSFLNFGLIFLGSGFGGVVRYWVGGLVQNWSGSQFPLGTFVVNISGCLAVGFLAAVLTGATALTGDTGIREEYRSALLVGVLGGYTTFSSFGRETLVLFNQGETFMAGLYVVGSVALSLVAVWFGAAVATKLYGAS